MRRVWCAGWLAWLLAASLGCSGVDGPTDGDPEAELEPSETVPAEVVLDCGGGTAVSFHVPCAVGMAPVYALECYSSTAEPPPVFGTMAGVALTMPTGEPIHIPTDMPLAPYDYAHFHLGAQTFRIDDVEGTAIFTSVDLDRRSFTGYFESLALTLSLEDGSASVTCRTGRAPFWAEPGTFL